MRIMFKQFIARLFCVLTALLLSSNIILSAVPFQKVKLTNSTKLSFSLSADVDHESTYIYEKEPFEDLDFVATIPSLPFFYSIGISSESEFNIVRNVNGPFFKSTPIWLFVKQILI